MTKIDRYLLFLYLRAFCISFASLSGLLIVVLLFTNLDEFQRFAAQKDQHLFQVVVEYYAPHLLTFYERLSGLLALLAFLFVVAWLNKTHEFTAMQAAGITKRRVVRPLLIASAVVILGAAAMRECAIPIYQDQLDRLPQDLTGELPRRMKPTVIAEAEGLLQGRHLLPAHFQIVAPWLLTQSGILARNFGSIIKAENGYFRPSEDGKPAGYIFINVAEPLTIDEKNSVFGANGKPILLTSKDTDWLQPRECFLASNVQYELLRGGSSWKQYASTGELVQRLRGETLSGNDLRVLIHGRFLRPVTDWTIILLGVPILLTRPDRHMFWVAGACLLLVSGFSAVVMALNALGATGTYLSPTICVWLPVLLFLPWAWARSNLAMES
ncbi:MAG: LptF/LptG family permease [Planctomycetota bacterium]|nr:LptF/LptG family permease [Planctomycetota bacterium]